MLRLSGANRRGTAANAAKKSWTSAKGSGTNPTGTDANTAQKFVQWIKTLILLRVEIPMSADQIRLK